MGDGGSLGTTFSDMMPLSKASSKDSKVADRCKPADMAGLESGPGWGCWGVSALTGGPSCVVSRCGASGEDGDGFADIAKVRRGQGLYTTL